jgi:hypothetical protein
MSNVSQPEGGEKPKRTCSLWDSGQGWVLTITTWPGTEAAVDEHYSLTALPSGYGRSFRLEKVVDGERPAYVVHLDADHPSCSCPGGSFHGRCKHLDTMLELQGKGALDKVPAPAAPAPPVKAPVPSSSPAATGWDDL